MILRTKAVSAIYRPVMLFAWIIGMAVLAAAPLPAAESSSADTSGASMSTVAPSGENVQTPVPGSTPTQAAGQTGDTPPGASAALPSQPAVVAAPTPLLTGGQGESPPVPAPTPEEAAAAEAVAESMPKPDPADKATQDSTKVAVETAEEAAARAEAAHKEKREQERKEILAEAEHFVETADQTIMTTLPYPLNLLFGVRLFGITLWRYLLGVGLVLLGVFLLYLLGRRFRKLERDIVTGEPKGRWQTAVDVAVLSLRKPAWLFIVSILLRTVSSLLVTSYHPDLVWLSSLLALLGVTMYFFDMVGIVDRVYGGTIFHSSDGLMETVRPILVKLLRFFILFVAGLQIYQGVTGQTMVSLLAGLGIGGLALALASQETLQNLLGFASIAFDKAFLVGDAVTIAGFDGTVEQVGIRSMRLRTYDGNSVVIPNSSAINSNIVNKNRRPFIRREIRIAISPLNPHGKVVAAMEAVQDVVAEHEGKVSGLPPVVRFVDFEPARFIIQVLFWYDADKPYFFDESSRVNLEICRKFTELGILYAER